MTSSLNSRWYLILLASAFLVIITLGVRQSFGLFLLPATEAMGTGREVFSLAMAMQNLVWGLASPLAGAMADKFGAAKVAATGAIFYAIGLFAMGAYISPEGLFFGHIMIGIGLGSAGMSIALGAVARATSAEKRSLALGLVVSIGSFGQFAVLPVTQFFINGFGWQMALILLSGVAASMLAACLVLHFKEDRPNATTADLARLSAKDALTTALGSRDYILLTTGFFVCGIQIVFIGTHLPTYLRDAGLSAEVASWSLAVVGLFNIIGSFAAGWLGSFMSKKKLLAWFYLGRSIFMVLFITLPPTPLTAISFGCIMGLLWLGPVPLTSGLIVVFFGPAFLSMLYGIAFLSHQVGSFIGAWLGGRIYDMLGSYDVMWWIVIASGVFAFVINYMIDEPKAEPRPAPAE